MLLYAHEESRTIEAPVEQVFATLADVPGHVSLAGSGEVRTIRLVTDGPIGAETEWDADEKVRFGKGTQEFTAHCAMSEFAPPYRIAWRSMPPGKPAAKRIEWTYQLAPAPSGGTVVTERVEVDLGVPMNLLMRLPYKRMRGNTVAAGMKKTLDNLAEVTAR